MARRPAKICVWLRQNRASSGDLAAFDRYLLAVPAQKVHTLLHCTACTVLGGTHILAAARPTAVCQIVGLDGGHHCMHCILLHILHCRQSPNSDPVLATVRHSISSLPIPLTDRTHPYRAIQLPTASSFAPCLPYIPSHGSRRTSALGTYSHEQPLVRTPASRRACLVLAFSRRVSSDDSHLRSSNDNTVIWLVPDWCSIRSLSPEIDSTTSVALRCPAFISALLAIRTLLQACLIHQVRCSLVYHRHLIFDSTQGVEAIFSQAPSPHLRKTLLSKSLDL